MTKMFCADLADGEQWPICHGDQGSHARTRARTHVCTHARMHARKHTHARMHTHGRTGSQVLKYGYERAVSHWRVQVADASSDPSPHTVQFEPYS